MLTIVQESTTADGAWSQSAWEVNATSLAWKLANSGLLSLVSTISSSRACFCWAPSTIFPNEYFEFLISFSGSSGSVQPLSLESTIYMSPSLPLASVSIIKSRINDATKAQWSARNILFKVSIKYCPLSYWEITYLLSNVFEVCPQKIWIFKQALHSFIKHGIVSV